MTSSRDRQALLLALSAEVRGWQADQEVFDSTVAELAGLNRTDWRCLDMLFTRGPMTAGEMAEAAQLTTGAVTGVLDHLEASGWVRRVRDTVDRRKVKVELTDKVQRESPAVYGPLLADGEKLLAGFGDEQLAVIVDFVRGERGLLTTHAARLREMLRTRREAAAGPADLEHRRRVSPI